MLKLLLLEKKGYFWEVNSVIAKMVLEFQLFQLLMMFEKDQMMNFDSFISELML